jgi:hypothetical protein
MDNEIVGVDDTEISDLMIDWQRLGEGLSDQHADWLPFLVFGMQHKQVAEIFGCDRSNISHGIRNNPELAVAIAQGRKMVKRQLHYVWLDQKAIAAWRNIDNILNRDPFEKDENDKYMYDAAMRRTIYLEQAKMSRFVVQQLGLHVQRHEVMHSAPEPMFKGDQKLASLVVERVTMAMESDPKVRDPEVIAGEYAVIKEHDKFEPTEEEKEVESPYEGHSRETSAYFEKQIKV